MESVVSARAVRLGRPVFPNEFFECVWDVSVTSNPRLKRHDEDKTKERAVNICVKIPELQGSKRFCVYPHSVIICKVGIEPAASGLPKSGIPPIRQTDFVEISHQFIASFASQEKYCSMLVGRAAPMGQCEVWVQAESEEIAAEMQATLTSIVRRENEKKYKALSKIQNLTRAEKPNSSQRHAGNDQSRGIRHSSSLSALSSMYSPKMYSPSSPSSSHHNFLGWTQESQSHSTLEPIVEAENREEQRQNGEKRQNRQSTAVREQRHLLRNYHAMVVSLEKTQQQLRDALLNQRTSYEKSMHPNIKQSSELDNADIAILRKFLAESSSLPFEELAESELSGLTGRRSTHPTQNKANVLHRAKSFSKIDAFKKQTSKLSSNEPTKQSLQEAKSPGEEEESEDSGGTLCMYNVGNSNQSDEVHGHLADADNEGSGATLIGSEGIDLSSIRHESNPQKTIEKFGHPLEFDKNEPTDMYTASKKSAFQVFQQQIEELKKGPRERTFEQSKMERDHEKASTTSSSDPLKSETSNEDDEREYITMMADRASCSSDSHLAISGHLENQANSEICSFTSESGDSCYSSMANGSLNPRAQSFSYECQRIATPLHHTACSTQKKGNNRAIPSALASRSLNESPSTERYPKGGSHLASHRGSVKKPTSYLMKENNLEIGSIHSPPMVEKDFCLNEDLRKRAFSLGSKSWLVRPLRKLVSTSRNLRGRLGSSSLINEEYGSDFHCSSRQPSSSSVISSLNQTRSSSISSGSFSFQPGTAGSNRSLSQKLNIRKKLSGQHPGDEDLVEMEFLDGELTRSFEHKPKPRNSSLTLRNSLTVTDEMDDPNEYVKMSNHRLPSTSTSSNHSSINLDPETMVVSQRLLRPNELFRTPTRFPPRSPSTLSSESDRPPRTISSSGRRRIGSSVSNYSFKEVHCFIAPADREKIDSITASQNMRKEKNFTSQEIHPRNSSSTHFETIIENASPPKNSNSNRPSLD